MNTQWPAENSEDGPPNVSPSGTQAAEAPTGTDEPAHSAGLVARGIAGAVHLAVSATRLTVRLARPVIMNPLLRPARDAVDSALTTVIDAVASIVAERLQHNFETQTLIEVVTDRLLKDLVSHERTAALVSAQARTFIDSLAATPALIGPLVEAAVAQYLTALRQNPTALRPLVQAVGGDYIAHLAEQPETVDGLVEAVAARFMATLRERPLLADGLVRTLADRYVAVLAQRPETLSTLVEGVAGGYIAALEERPELLDGVVQRVAGAYLETLKQHPEQLDALVQAVGSRYLENLNANPGSVQDLLAGQSVSMATEIVSEVRSRTTVADNGLEALVRNLLRKRPRTELAPSAAVLPGSANGA